MHSDKYECFRSLIKLPFFNREDLELYGIITLQKKMTSLISYNSESQDLHFLCNEKFTMSENLNKNNSATRQLFNQTKVSN